MTRFVGIMLVVVAVPACSRRAGTEAPASVALRDALAPAPAPNKAGPVYAKPAATLLGRPPPEPSAGAPTWSGKVDQEFWQVGDFFYDWNSPAGKLRFEIVKSIVHQDAGEVDGLIVTAQVGGKRTPILVWPNINAGSKTSLLVKPVKKRGLLGIAIMSDWSDGQQAPESDWSAEIRWDGNDVLVHEGETSNWAK